MCVKQNKSSLFVGLIYFLQIMVNQAQQHHHTFSCDNLQLAVHPHTKHMQISLHVSVAVNVFFLSVGVME